MNQRALAAETAGTFMLVTSVLGAALFEGGSPAVGMGVALAIGLTVMAMAYAFGALSGAHFNPAVTIGLIAGGRFEQSKAPGYIAAQCIGAVLAATLFVFAIGMGNAKDLAGVSNGYGPLSPKGAGILAVFTIELLLTAFFMIVIMGTTARKVPPGFAPIAIGLALTAIHLIAIPISNASVNPARSLGTALWGGWLAISQLWVFWAAPILGAVVGGLFGRWLLEE
ncbi:MAG: aquaporin [Hyphomicrobiaceae bacterium]